MPVSYGKGARAKATRLCSEIVRARGMCERCGGNGPFDHAHIIRRTYSFTRSDEKNGWCLCRSCHYLVDNFADEMNLMIERTIGWDEYCRLKTKAGLGVRKKFDWDAEVARLLEVKAGLDACS